MRYVELHCKSNFSFLEGASHADELMQRAAVVASLQETIGLCRGAALSELPSGVRQKAQDSVAQLLGKERG